MSNPFSSGTSVVQRVAPQAGRIVGMAGDANPQIVTPQQRLAKAQRGNTIVGGSMPREAAAPLYSGNRLGAGA